MYYKIIDQSAQIYQELLKLRIKERVIDAAKKKAIEQKTGMKFDAYVGTHGQGFIRTVEMESFKFINAPFTEDFKKTWREDKDFPGYYEPNKRTKQGREMAEFISGGKAVWYIELLDVLKITDKARRFHLPTMDITKDGVCVLFLDDQHVPINEAIIEITRTEFYALYTPAPPPVEELEKMYIQILKDYENKSEK